MSDETPLENCGCCESDPLPAPIYNRPGLPTLAYRAGSYATIFRRMRDRIVAAGLGALTTRSQDDPSLALLDASAVMSDVLTFYQERIANEGFLRTATEQRSIREMARGIGYELSPGVAASVYLSFTVDDAQGAPGVSSIPAGIKVQNIPLPGKLPQTFETSEDFVAHKEWNDLRPQLSERQNVTAQVTEIYLKGTGHKLTTSDVMLVSSGTDALTLVHIKEAKIDSTGQFTHVTFEPRQGTIHDIIIANIAVMAMTAPSRPWTASVKIPFNADTIEENILGKRWPDSDLAAFLQTNEWDVNVFSRYLAERRSQRGDVHGVAYVMRTHLGIFGHNAPKWESLPASQHFGEKVSGADGAIHNQAGSYPNSWEGRNITTDSQGGGHTSNASFFLDRSVPDLSVDGYVALEQGTTSCVYSLKDLAETSLSDYAISGKVTALWVDTTPAGVIQLKEFLVRSTTAYVNSERLSLTEMPTPNNIPAENPEIKLDCFVYGLRVGQAVSLSGERADIEGLKHSEVLIIKSIDHDHGLTVLTFESGPACSYKRETLHLNANTVTATHGETVQEILGSGDGALIGQEFTLKKPPLTYTVTPERGGAVSSLQVRVNDLLWDEAASLYGLGPKEQAYIIRINDQPEGAGGASTATILFGDGEKGERLPTGQNNITATYRSGIGLEGQVAAGSLRLLPSRPFGIREVTNPLAASNAGEPEKMDAARRNAPLTVRTLDRIVSLTDYEDFAAAFAGVGKAQAVALWNGEQHIVHVTIAGEDGVPILDGPFRDNFILAVDQARDPAQQVRVDTFDLLLFNLELNVSVDRRYLRDKVFTAIEAKLKETFSFEKRAFGQPVTAAEITALVQGLAGVVYVDLELLYFPALDEDLTQVLPASPAQVQGGIVQKAQLLLLNPVGIRLQEVSK